MCYPYVVARVMDSEFYPLGSTPEDLSCLPTIDGSAIWGANSTTLGAYSTKTMPPRRTDDYTEAILRYAGRGSRHHATSFSPRPRLHGNCGTPQGRFAHGASNVYLVHESPVCARKAAMLIAKASRHRIATFAAKSAHRRP